MSASSLLSQKRKRNDDDDVQEKEKEDDEKIITKKQKTTPQIKKEEEKNQVSTKLTVPQNIYDMIQTWLNSPKEKELEIRMGRKQTSMTREFMTTLSDKDYDNALTLALEKYEKHHTSSTHIVKYHSSVIRQVDNQWQRKQLLDQIQWQSPACRYDVRFCLSKEETILKPNKIKDDKSVKIREKTMDRFDIDPGMRIELSEVKTNHGYVVTFEMECEFIYQKSYDVNRYILLLEQALLLLND